MLVTVSWGFVPVQLGFGHPAADPDTVDAAVRTAALVVNVTFPFLIAAEPMFVGVVTGPVRTRFWPAASLPPPLVHVYTAKPLTVVLITRFAPLRPASVAVQVVDVLLVPPPVMVHTGVPPFLKCGLAARDAWARITTSASAGTNAFQIRRMMPPL